MEKSELVSPNNWLTKAGGYLDGDRVVLPHQFLAVPLTLASESILEFRAHENIGQKIKYGLLVVTMIRIADTAFYNFIADFLNQSSPNVPNICANCIRGQICNTNMKSYRQIANKNVIHKMEHGEVVNFSDLEIVEKYYEEIFKLPLMNPSSFPERKDLELCQRCRQKWKKWRAKINQSSEP